jgi:fumarate reductase flavoprotein subunit
MNESSLPQVVRADGMPAGTPELAVVIVGAGACGLTTGIALRRAGVDCVILERDARATGSTALSSGFIPAAETALQKSLGIEDTHEMLVEDIVNKAHGQAPRPLVQAYVEAVTEALDALQAYGLPFEIVDGFLYPGHRVRRMHSMPEKTGETFITRLEQLAVAQGVDILLEALVRELWVDADQRVLGVGYQRPDGQMEYLACRQLMLACNGFGGNPTLVRELLPEMAQATFAGHQGNDGTAIGWARQLGLRMADLDAYQGHGSWVTPQGALMTWAFIMEGGVQVNAQGRRFNDETGGYSEAAVHVLAQPGSVAWNVFDGPLLELLRGFPDFRDAEAAGALRMATDAAALAALIGCDVSMLKTTLAEIRPGHTDAFGRRFTRALQAPYYGVKVTGALFHTQGGLDIDTRCRVLRSDGQAMVNLYAAGGAARGVSGRGADGYLAGNGLLSAVGGGWLAARDMAARFSAGGLD